MKRQSILKTLAFAGGLALVAWNSSAADTAGAPAPQLNYATTQILKLEQAKLTDDIVINYIRSSGDFYDLNADTVIYLRQHGVSEPVLLAMLTQSKAPAAPAAPGFGTPPAAQAPMAPPSGAMYPPAGSMPPAGPDAQVPPPTAVPTDAGVPVATTYYYGPDYYAYYGWPYYGYGWPYVGVGWGWGWGWGWYGGHWGWGWRGGDWHGGWHGGDWHGGAGYHGGGGFHGAAGGFHGGGHR